MTSYRRTVRLALPAVAESLLNSLVLLVDALMVAQVGDAALAAVGLAGVVLWRSRSLAAVLQIGLSAVVARRWGEGNERAAGILLTHGVILGLLMGLIPLIALPFARPLFASLNAEGAVLAQAAIYFQIVLATMPMRMASANLSATMRACGDTRTPMLVTLTINVVNTVFNYLLIFGHGGFPALGLMGAGISTAIAFTVEVAALSWAAARGIRPLRFLEGEGSASGQSRGLLIFHRAGATPWLPGVTGSVMKVSLPSLGEEIAVSVGFLGFIAMIAGLGEGPLAAHTSVTRIESFSFMIGFGISVGSAALVGQALGAKRVDLARRAFSASLVLAASAMSLAGLAMIGFSPWTLGLFYGFDDSRRTMIELATPILIIAAIEQPFIGMANVLASGLRGAGMTIAPFVSQIFGTIVVRIGLGYLLAFGLEMGLEGIYWGTVADWVLRVIILGSIVLGGRWEKMKL